MFDVAFPIAEHRYLPLVGVKARDIEPCLAEFDDEREADVAQADDGDAGGFGINFCEQGHGDAPRREGRKWF